VNTKKRFKTTDGFIDKCSYLLSPLAPDLEEKSKRILSGFIVIFTAPVLLIFSVLHLVKADYPLGIFLLIAGLGLAVSIALLRFEGSFMPSLNLNPANYCMPGILSKCAAGTTWATQRVCKYAAKSKLDGQKKTTASAMGLIEDIMKAKRISTFILIIF